MKSQGHPPLSLFLVPYPRRRYCAFHLSRRQWLCEVIIARCITCPRCPAGSKIPFSCGTYPPTSRSRGEIAQVVIRNGASFFLTDVFYWLILSCRRLTQQSYEPDAGCLWHPAVCPISFAADPSNCSTEGGNLPSWKELRYRQSKRLSSIFYGTRS